MVSTEPWEWRKARILFQAEAQDTVGLTKDQYSLEIFPAYYPPDFTPAYLSRELGRIDFLPTFFPLKELSPRLLKKILHLSDFSSEGTRRQLSKSLCTRRDYSEKAYRHPLTLQKLPI